MRILFAYCLLLLPGFFLTGLLKFKTARFLFSIALSVFVAVVCVLTAKLLNTDQRVVILLWAGTGSLLGFLLFLTAKPSTSLMTSIKTDIFELREWPAWIFLAFGCVVYTAISGPYAEIPGDPIWHIGKINDQFEFLQNDDAFHASNFALTNPFSKIHAYWYVVQANIIYWSGYTPEKALYWMSIAHSVILLLSFFQFSLVILNRISTSRGDNLVIATLATFLFATHFGLGVFSFFRYYTFGPVYLNMVLYFSAVVALLHYLSLSTYFNRWLLYLVIALIGMTLIHKQEALFLLVLGLLMTLLDYWRNRTSIKWRDLAGAKKLVLAVGIIIMYLLVHGWLYTSVVRNNPLTQGLLTDVKVLLPFLKNLYILRPDFQFFQVITAWGVLVYALYYSSGKVLTTSLYISAGMFVPFITVFNPVFTDLFLRVSWPEVLWRICYVIPLHLVGAWFIFSGCKKIIIGNWKEKLTSAVICGALVVLLAPVDNHYFSNSYSKLTMLKPVEPRNDYRVWKELITALNSMPKSLVLTDPITGYTLNAYTNHSFPSHKFGGRGIMSMGHQHYEKTDFVTYKDWLLVINNKSGGISKIGEMGRHWSKNAMRPILFYDGTLQGFVSNNPDLFTLLWENEKQWVYRIH